MQSLDKTLYTCRIFVAVLKIQSNFQNKAQDSNLEQNIQREKDLIRQKQMSISSDRERPF